MYVYSSEDTCASLHTHTHTLFSVLCFSVELSSVALPRGFINILLSSEYSCHWIPLLCSCLYRSSLLQSNIQSFFFFLNQIFHVRAYTEAYFSPRCFPKNDSFIVQVQRCVCDVELFKSNVCAKMWLSNTGMATSRIHQIFNELCSFYSQRINPKWRYEKKIVLNSAFSKLPFLNLR